ncbi:MAG: 3-methyladenine DNA glycosylase [Deltaproteobacteria bacterium CG11_big_fil_rev_8_21_14_0_20_45_16]|nr:MAG: 3-methyladenine DNA glycosylase [Deltaproteobacteria bacterium CG11_big_fil_rev_8_21_14_0_20_45_16]
MPARKLNRRFFNRPADAVARDLIGCSLIIRNKHKKFELRIVETEAYLGEKDLACHSAKGRTKRTEVMFGPPGFAYIYLIYGIYQMFNIVCSGKGDPQAVLIRAAESLSDPKIDLSGPGKFTRALGINRSWNAMDLVGEKVFFCKRPYQAQIKRAARIGVDYAGAWAARPLRFFDARSSALSVRPK